MRSLENIQVTMRSWQTKIWLANRKLIWCHNFKNYSCILTVSFELSMPCYCRAILPVAMLLLDASKHTGETLWWTHLKKSWVSSSFGAWTYFPPKIWMTTFTNFFELCMQVHSAIPTNHQQNQLENHVQACEPWPIWPAAFLRCTKYGQWASTAGVIRKNKSIDIQSLLLIVLSRNTGFS